MVYTIIFWGVYLIMSEESLKQFLNKVKKDHELLIKVRSASSSEELVNIAREQGFDVSVKEISDITFVKQQYEKPEMYSIGDSEGKLSEEDLEKVAGGGASCRDGYHPGGLSEAQGKDRAKKDIGY